MMKFKLTSIALGIMTCISATALAQDANVQGASVKQSTSYDYSDNQPWSQMPPAQLRPVQVPLFISIGFDDNGSKEGMDWIINFTKQLENANTANNAATFDGSPVRFSFYNTPSYIESIANDPVGIKHAWRQAWLDGHEVGNHTWSHRDGGPDTNNFSEQEWTEELNITQTWLSKPFDPYELNSGANDAAGPGIPVGEIIGFRTPYLNHNNALFSALVKGNFVYDTSIEEGWGNQYNGTNNPWPYTMNNGTPTKRVGKPDVGNFPGLWQLPSNVFEKPFGGKMVAFDTNMWVGSAMSKDEVLAILKHNLHLRLEGNRSPLLYGAHANIYASEYDKGGRATTYIERQQAIEEFIQYALSLKVNGQPVVRIVPFKDIVEWMRNPKPLTDGKVVTVQSIGASPTFIQGSIYRKGDQVYHDGKYFEAKWYADTAPGALAVDYDPWKLITKEQATKVMHLGSVTPNGDTYGDVLVSPSNGQTFFFEAAANARVKSVTLNGVNIGALTEYTFKDLTSNQTLTVEFESK
ncbi:polysaccharide deacetylase family protein [Pseudoalteromonas luteoviolacea]|uniref:polysaccharide deacetylase family protein n=1 Tax=Pseudoalteromonas luteoviolacea TaxID=43657 RepID=UPI0012DA5B35|nr:polysaccharide deacetylase family protein [Pseudoalteromonas luteoviolacea]